jgi:hypothetical protein
MFKALTFVDDAGREVESQIDGARVATRDDSGLNELMQRYTMVCAQRQNDDVKQAAFLGGLVFLVVFIFMVASGPWAWAPWLLTAVIPLLIAGPIVLVSLRARSRMMAEFREYLVSYGRCGGCGYPLRTLPVDTNGHVTCSECRAAWRADRARFDEPQVTKRDEVPEETATIKRFLGLNSMFPVVTDDDGRVFRTADPRLPGARAWLGEDWNAARSRVRGRLIWVQAKHFAFALMIVPAVFFLIPEVKHASQAIANGMMPSGMQFLALVALPSFIISYPQSLWQIWRFQWPTLGKPVAASLLKEGLCPACSRGLPLATEGRRVCEHCGGAWSDKMFEEPTA